MTPDAPTPDHRETDADLLARGSAGDERAIRTLVTRHIRSATLLAAQLLGDRDDAEDVVQEAFLVVLRRAGQFDATAHFPSWLFGIVRRLAFKHRARAARRWHLLERSRARDHRVAQPTAQAGLEAAEIRAAIQTLPSMQRACCELAFVHGLSTEEISQMYNVTTSTVRQHIFRGRQRLRTLLAGDSEEPQQP